MELPGEREPGSMDGPGARRRNRPRIALARARLSGVTVRVRAIETCAFSRGWASRGSRPTRSAAPARRLRSEEHTSELQSLMRISYAVFCLKKKHSEARYMYCEHNCRT